MEKVERTIAKRLGGQRVGAAGRAAADVQTHWLAAEVKHRRRLPQWLKDALAQAVAGANDEQLPVVVLHEAGGRHDDDLVLLRLRDFQEWFGD